MADQDSEKLRWEIEKLKLESRNLAQPFRRQPAAWFAVATLVLSLGGNVLQYSKAERGRELAQIQREKLDLETQKLQKDKSQLLDDISKQRVVLQQASEELQGFQERLGTLQREIASATTNREALSRTIAEVKKSASAAQVVNENTADSLAALSVGRQSRYVPNWSLAAEKEREGFLALIEGRFDAAGQAFQASEDAAHGYHYAYELARLVRQRRSDLDDPAKRKEVFHLIVTQRATGAPKDLVDRLRQLGS